MKPLDRLLQRWRIKRAAAFIPKGVRLLDIGCADGALYRILKPKLHSYVGIDPTLTGSVDEGKFQLIAGSFPEDFPSMPAFDVITLLAILEHLSLEEQEQVASGCYANLTPDGIVVVTSPAPSVDYLLRLLRGLRIIDGICLDDHYGWDVNKTPEVFQRSDLICSHHQRFELGQNHLFVFRKDGIV